VTPERARLFAELVEEVVSADKGFVPKEAWMTLHKLIPLPAVEVLVTRKDGREFILNYREDQGWNGWHIPGSFIRPHESLEEACNRVTREELELDGITGLQAIGILKWEPGEHPFGGTPISIVMVGYPVGEIRESRDTRYFSSIPSPMITNHATLLGGYLSYLKKPHTGLQILAA
jgi:hypothetical protein